MSDYGSAPPPPPPPPDDSGQGSYPGMQSMSGGTPPPAGPVSQPRSIANAVKLMYVGAALSVVGILITLFMRDTIREQVEKGAADAGRDMSPSDIDAAVAVAVGFSVVVGLLGVGLWLWMAWANGKGKKWARIVATVFFALSLVSFLLSLLQSPPPLSLVSSIVSVLLGATIIYLLYRPESTQYYEAQSAPRY